MIINTKDTIKIIVTNILVKLHNKTGKALSQVTLVSSELLFAVSDSIHLPINGTFVLSSTQQHTPFLLHNSQVPFTFFVPVGHEHILNEFIFQLIGGEQEAAHTSVHHAHASVHHAHASVHHASVHHASVHHASVHHAVGDAHAAAD